MRGARKALCPEGRNPRKGIETANSGRLPLFSSPSFRKNLILDRGLEHEGVEFLGGIHKLIGKDLVLEIGKVIRDVCCCLL